MKKLCAMAALMLTLGTFAAEALPTANEVWRGGGWNNWAEIVTKADAGKLDTGKEAWIIDLARYFTGKIDAAELWKRADAVLPAEQYVIRYAEVGYRILLKEPESETAAKIRALMGAALAGEDEGAAKAAHAAYGRWSAKRGDYAAAWTHFLACGIYQNNAVDAAARLMRDKANAETVYRGAVRLYDAGVEAAPARRLAGLLQRAAVTAKIPAAEVRAELEKIHRLYSGKAVGDSGEAKQWGLFLGSLRDSINAW